MPTRVHSVDTDRRTGPSGATIDVVSDDPRPREMPREMQRAALLADPTRARLHALLEAEPEGLAVSDMAHQLGLHHTSVRSQLRLLLEADLVESIRQGPSGRGRPRLLYRARPRSEGAYRALAETLVEAIGRGISPEEAGRRAGRGAAALHLGKDAVTAIVAEGRRLGFRAEAEMDADPANGRDRGGVEAVSIVLHDCPYLDLVESDPVTVCAVHLGFARGVADTVGGAHVEALEVGDPRGGGCRLRLTRSRDD